MTEELMLETIHESYLNGNKAQAVQQIDEYFKVTSEFFEKYRDFLHETYNYQNSFAYYTNIVITYFRIKSG